MGRPDPGAERHKQLAGLDRLIHEPGRLAVMSLLAVVQEADFLFLLDQTGLTRGNLSSHMARLEKAGYVAVQKEFVEKVPRTSFTLTPEGAAAFTAYRRGLLAYLGEEGGK